MAFGSKETESFTNSNELTFTGHPRKWMRGLCDTKAATIANFFSQKVSQKQFSLNTCCYTEFLFESCHTQQLRGHFGFVFAFCNITVPIMKLAFLGDFQENKPVLYWSKAQVACLYYQNTGFGPCWFLVRVLSLLKWWGRVSEKENEKEKIKNWSHNSTLRVAIGHTRVKPSSVWVIHMVLEVLCFPAKLEK